MPYYSKVWADWVNAQMKKNDRPARWLANKWGVDSSYISLWKDGRIPSRGLIHKMCETAGIDPDEMLLAAGYIPLKKHQRLMKSLKGAKQIVQK